MPLVAVQFLVSVLVEGMHVPPEHVYSVTVRDCVPVPPQVVAEQVLQGPYSVVSRRAGEPPSWKMMQKFS